MFCFSHSTELLLATACLLLSPAVSAERATTCGNRPSVHHLRCDVGVISVQNALYGRADRETCSEGKPPSQLANTECSLAGAVDTVQTRCDGKKECEININDVRTSDPCPGIFKYLETNFTCLPAIQHIACEESVAHLYCGEGQVIFVYGADYGRRDRTTCSHRRPDLEVQNVLCSNPTGRVAESCDGKNTCDVNVSNSVFTDPCEGTYKYLEVAYHCEYPDLAPEASGEVH